MPQRPAQPDLRGPTKLGVPRFLEVREQRVDRAIQHQRQPKQHRKEQGPGDVAPTCDLDPADSASYHTNRRAGEYDDEAVERAEWFTHPRGRTDECGGAGNEW